MCNIFSFQLMYQLPWWKQKFNFGLIQKEENKINTVHYICTLYMYISVYLNFFTKLTLLFFKCLFSFFDEMGFFVLLCGFAHFYSSLLRADFLNIIFKALYDSDFVFSRPTVLNSFLTLWNVSNVLHSL